MNDSRFTIDELQRATVVDQDGDKVGSVGQIYVDDDTDQPNFATVNTGLFGTRESFVPLEGATLTNGELRVPYTKAFIKDAPNIDSDGHIDEGEQDELFRYYSSNRGTDRGVTDRDDTARNAAAGGVAGGVAGDRDRDRDLDRDRNAVAGDRERDRDRDDESIVRREEEVKVGKERVETGRVRLRKHVVQDTKTIEVPVEREEFEVVREPISGGNRGGKLGDDEAEVTLSEERPVVEKEVVDKERIGLDKNTVRDTEQVQTEVGREEVEVVQDADSRTGNARTGAAGDEDRSGWTDADYESRGYKRDKSGNWLDKLGNKLDRDNDGHIG